ncbi:MAG TPA: hypothetical protein VFQ00_01435 [Terriglobales bacterium]|nr:hypothetical protein [Terriglobales bacterium]
MHVRSFPFRVCFVLPLLVIAISAVAQEPAGEFQCRHQAVSDGSAYPQPVAYLWLHADGHYELLDLTTTKGKTSGHYSYDLANHEIDWKSGDLSKLAGHYLPTASLTMLNTKKDPAGHVDGTLPCVRIPSPQ